MIEKWCTFLYYTTIFYPALLIECICRLNSFTFQRVSWTAGTSSSPGSDVKTVSSSKGSKCKKEVIGLYLFKNQVRIALCGISECCVNGTIDVNTNRTKLYKRVENQYRLL